MGLLSRHHLRLARSNRLANHRLDDACLALSHDEWMAPRTSFFPSIAETMNHILVVDRYYVDALEDAGLGRSVFGDRMPCRTMPALAAAQREVDERLVAFCRRLDDAGDDTALLGAVKLDRGARGTLVDRIDLTLAHVFMHATHHRGQVHAMLSGTSVAPPQLDDFIMGTDTAARVGDLAAVGMSESDLA